MKFRKSIKLGKGVKLNVSKSGLSTTFGIKGLSVNTGKNGTYLNTGIPGTGLYERKKIGGSAPGNEAKGTYGGIQNNDSTPKSAKTVIRKIFAIIFLIVAILFTVIAIAMIFVPGDGDGVKWFSVGITAFPVK